MQASSTSRFVCVPLVVPMYQTPCSEPVESSGAGELQQHDDGALPVVHDLEVSVSVYGEYLKLLIPDFCINT
jgi:hypothetical protein